MPHELSDFKLYAAGSTIKIETKIDGLSLMLFYNDKTHPIYKRYTEILATTPNVYSVNIATIPNFQIVFGATLWIYKNGVPAQPFFFNAPITNITLESILEQQTKYVDARGCRDCHRVYLTQATSPNEFYSEGSRAYKCRSCQDYETTEKFRKICEIMKATDKPKPLETGIKEKLQIQHDGLFVRVQTLKEKRRLYEESMKLNIDKLAAEYDESIKSFEDYQTKMNHEEAVLTELIASRTKIKNEYTAMMTAKIVALQEEADRLKEYELIELSEAK